MGWQPLLRLSCTAQHLHSRDREVQRTTGPSWKPRQDPWEQVPCAPPKDPGGLSLSHALWFQLRAGSLSAPTQGKLSQRVPLFFQLAGGQRSSEKGLLRKSHCLFAPSHGHCLAEHSAATSCECDHENMQIWMRRHAEQSRQASSFLKTGRTVLWKR